jgi:hypothetical protein
VKRTHASPRLAIIAAFVLATACGDGGAGTPTDADGGPSAAGGAGGARTGGSTGPASGGAGGRFGGTGGSSGSGPTDGGNHDCPSDPPLDGSSCSGRNSCSYVDTVCTCVRSQSQDAGREWNCFDNGMHDGGVCPAAPAQEGEPCLIAGSKCPKDTQGFCSCTVADGNLQWQC